MLEVMNELKENEFFHTPNTLLEYTLSQEDQGLNNDTFCGRLTGIWDLLRLKAIVIHNRGDERIPNTTIYEFEIIIQPSFDDVYKRCVKETTGQGLDQYENTTMVKKSKNILTKLLNSVIKANEITGMQAQLLLQLSNFEPTSVEFLESKISTKDLKSLKKNTNEKINGNGFNIVYVPDKSSLRRGCYILKYIQTQTSLH